MYSIIKTEEVVETFVQVVPNNWNKKPFIQAKVALTKLQKELSNFNIEDAVSCLKEKRQLTDKVKYIVLYIINS